MSDITGSGAAARGELILYSTEDGRAESQLRAEEGTVWLSQAQMALFDTTKQHVSLHMRNLLAEGEVGHSGVKQSLIPASDGCHRRSSGATYKNVYGRMEWDRPAPTLTTGCFSFGRGRFGHPEQDRATSLREAALLQSFPAGYRLAELGAPVAFSHLGRHLGNAVPVALGAAIGKAIRGHVEEVGALRDSLPERRIKGLMTVAETEWILRTMTAHQGATGLSALS